MSYSIRQFLRQLPLCRRYITRYNSVIGLKSLSFEVTRNRSPVLLSNSILFYSSGDQNSSNEQIANMTEVNYSTLKGLLDKDIVTLIDVRNPDELKEDGKIPKSKNVPLPQLPDDFSKLTDKEFHAKYGFDKPLHSAMLVTACRAGRRAATAADALMKMGYSNVSVYNGSFNDWKEKGGPIEKVTGGPVEKVTGGPIEKDKGGVTIEKVKK